MRVHTRGPEAAHLGDDRAVDEILRCIEPYRPQPAVHRASDLDTGAHAVVLVVDEGDDLHVRIGVLRELPGREYRVSAVRRYERVRDGADAGRAPPAGLRVRRHTDCTR